MRGPPLTCQPLPICVAAGAEAGVAVCAAAVAAVPPSECKRGLGGGGSCGVGGRVLAAAVAADAAARA